MQLKERVFSRLTRDHWVDPHWSVTSQGETKAHVALADSDCPVEADTRCGEKWCMQFMHKWGFLWMALSSGWLLKYGFKMERKWPNYSIFMSLAYYKGSFFIKNITEWEQQQPRCCVYKKMCLHQNIWKLVSDLKDLKMIRTRSIIMT